jgi:hypothetical protein
LNQAQNAAAGQVSADGQFRWDGTQWVPIPKGQREPTPWTRPIQLGAAALLALEAIVTVASVVVYYTHDAVKQTLAATGQQVPQGLTEDQFISYTIGGAIGFAVFLAVLELFGALGSLLRWRWIFWYVLVLMGLGTLSALFGLAGLFRTNTSPIPTGVQVFEEIIALGAAGMFIWMLVGVIKYGPWAMKKPGA